MANERINASNVAENATPADTDVLPVARQGNTGKYNISLSRIKDFILPQAERDRIPTAEEKARIPTAEEKANILTNAEKARLDALAENGEQNIQADWDETNTTDDAFILNKPESLNARVPQWDNATAYKATQVVRINNRTYIANKDVPVGQVSPSADHAGNYWDRFDFLSVRVFNANEDFVAGELVLVASGASYLVYRADNARNGSTTPLLAPEADPTNWTQVAENTDTFLGLSDTPGAFVAGAFLRINETADGVEYAAVDLENLVQGSSGATTFLALTDTPAQFEEGQILVARNGALVFESKGSAATDYATDPEAIDGETREKAINPANLRAVMDNTQPPAPHDFLPFFESENASVRSSVEAGQTYSLDIAFVTNAITGGATGLTNASGRIRFGRLSSAEFQDVYVAARIPIILDYCHANITLSLFAYDPLAADTPLTDHSFVLREAKAGVPNAATSPSYIVFPTEEIRAKVKAGLLYKLRAQFEVTDTGGDNAGLRKVGIANDAESSKGRFGLWVTPTQPISKVVHQAYDAANKDNIEKDEQFWYNGDLYQALVNAPQGLPTQASRTIPADPTATKEFSFTPENNGSGTRAGWTIAGNAADHFGFTNDDTHLGSTSYQLRSIEADTDGNGTVFFVEFFGSVPESGLRTMEAPNGNTLDFSAATRLDRHDRTSYSWPNINAPFATDRKYELTIGFVEPEKVVAEWSRIQDVNRIPPFADADKGKLLYVNDSRQVGVESPQDAVGDLITDANPRKRASISRLPTLPFEDLAAPATGEAAGYAKGDVVHVINAGQWVVSEQPDEDRNRLEAVLNKLGNANNYEAGLLLGRTDGGAIHRHDRDTGEIVVISVTDLIATGSNAKFNIEVKTGGSIEGSANRQAVVSWTHKTNGVQTQTFNLTPNGPGANTGTHKFSSAALTGATSGGWTLQKKFFYEAMQQAENVNGAGYLRIEWKDGSATHDPIPFLPKWYWAPDNIDGLVSQIARLSVKEKLELQHKSGIIPDLPNSDAEVVPGALAMLGNRLMLGEPPKAAIASTQRNIAHITLVRTVDAITGQVTYSAGNGVGNIDGNNSGIVALLRMWEAHIQEGDEDSQNPQYDAGAEMNLELVNSRITRGTGGGSIIPQYIKVSYTGSDGSAQAFILSDTGNLRNGVNRVYEWSAGGPAVHAAYDFKLPANLQIAVSFDYTATHGNRPDARDVTTDFTINQNFAQASRSASWKDVANDLKWETVYNNASHASQANGDLLSLTKSIADAKMVVVMVDVRANSAQGSFVVLEELVIVPPFYTAEDSIERSINRLTDYVYFLRGAFSDAAGYILGDARDPNPLPQEQREAARRDLSKFYIKKTNGYTIMEIRAAF